MASAYKVAPAGTKYRCLICGSVSTLRSPAVVRKSEDDEELFVIDLPVNCALCGCERAGITLADAPSLFTKRGRQSTFRGERFHSTVRWDPDVYEQINILSGQTGKSISDIVNAAFRKPGILEEVRAQLAKPSGDKRLQWSLDRTVRDG